MTIEIPAEYRATDLADLYLAKNGEIVEVLSEGEWHRVVWGRADDMSPYGTTGFAAIDNSNLFFPEDLIESWRETIE